MKERIMDVVSLICDCLAVFHHGWRFYVPIAIVACIGIAIHFTVGWNSVTEGVIIVGALVGVVSGVYWEYVCERSSNAGD